MSVACIASAFYFLTFIIWKKKINGLARILLLPQKLPQGWGLRLNNVYLAEQMKSILFLCSSVSFTFYEGKLERDRIQWEQG